MLTRKLNLRHPFPSASLRCINIVDAWLIDFVVDSEDIFLVCCGIQLPIEGVTREL